MLRQTLMAQKFLAIFLYPHFFTSFCWGGSV